MIVADSSVWIDFFNGVESPEVDRLDDALGRERVVVGDVILLEVLQGFRSDADHAAARAALAPLTVLPMLGEDAAVRAAERYRALRHRGVTVRKAVDVIIASACLDAGLPLLRRPGLRSLRAAPRPADGVAPHRPPWAGGRHRQSVRTSSTRSARSRTVYGTVSPTSGSRGACRRLSSHG